MCSSDLFTISSNDRVCIIQCTSGYFFNAWTHLKEGELIAKIAPSRPFNKAGMSHRVCGFPSSSLLANIAAFESSKILSSLLSISYESIFTPFCPMNKKYSETLFGTALLYPGMTQNSTFFRTKPSNNLLHPFYDQSLYGPFGNNGHMACLFLCPRSK